MDILVRSRQSILTDYPANSTWVLISVHEPSFPPVDTPTDGLQDLMMLSFSDTDDHDSTRMNESQAKSILRFFEKWKDKVDHVVCQCDAGISRSSALAAALSIVHKGAKQDQWVFSNPLYKPNMHVYRLILDQAGKQGLI